MTETFCVDRMRSDASCALWDSLVYQKWPVLKICDWDLRKNCDSSLNTNLYPRRYVPVYGKLVIKINIHSVCGNQILLFVFFWEHFHLCFSLITLISISFIINIFFLVECSQLCEHGTHQYIHQVHFFFILVTCVSFHSAQSPRLPSTSWTPTAAICCVLLVTLWVNNGYSPLMKLWANLSPMFLGSTPECLFSQLKSKNSLSFWVLSVFQCASKDWLCVHTYLHFRLSSSRIETRNFHSFPGHR